MQTGKTPNDYQPIPNVPGHVALLANGSLLLETVGPQDEGHYLCRASNGIGSVLNKMIYVEVNGNERYKIPRKLTMNAGTTFYA